MIHIANFGKLLYRFLIFYRGQQIYYCLIKCVKCVCSLLDLCPVKRSADTENRAAKFEFLCRLKRCCYVDTYTL